MKVYKDKAIVLLTYVGWLFLMVINQSSWGGNNKFEKHLQPISLFFGRTQVQDITTFPFRENVYFYHLIHFYFFPTWVIMQNLVQCPYFLK